MLVRYKTVLFTDEMIKVSNLESIRRFLVQEKYTAEALKKKRETEEKKVWNGLDVRKKCSLTNLKSRPLQSSCGSECEIKQ